MKYKDIKAIIANTRLPNAYYAFREGEVPDLPYIVWYFPAMRPEVADNSIHAQISALNIELYTLNKDFATEAAVETVLANAGLIWRKSEAILDDEDMYETLYEMEVLIDG